MPVEFGPFPIPSEAFHLTAVVLALVLLFLTYYVWQRYARLGTFRVPSPVLIGVLGILFLMFVTRLGWHRGLYAFDLAFGIVLSLMSPMVAVSFLIAHLFLRPWELVPHTPLLELVPRMLGGVCLLSWLMHTLSRRYFHIVWNVPYGCLLVFLGWVAVSSLFSQTPDESLKVFGESFFPILVITFLVLNCVHDELDLLALKGSVILSVLGVVCVALTLSYGPAHMLETSGRLQGAGMWSNSNDLAALAAMVLPLVVFPALERREHLIAFLFCSCALVVLIIGVWSSQSRGAILSLGVGGVAYFAMCARGHRNPSTRSRSVIIALFAIVLALILFTKISREREDLSESRAARLNYFMTGLKMARHFPVFGVGMGNYERLYESYSEEFLEWGERTAHSSWTLVMAETGFMGLLLFGILAAATFERAWRLRNGHPEYLIAIVSYGVAMSFLSHTYLLAPYLLLALVVSASRIYATPQVRSHVSVGEVLHAHA